MTSKRNLYTSQAAAGIGMLSISTLMVSAIRCQDPFRYGESWLFMYWSHCFYSLEFSSLVYTAFGSLVPVFGAFRMIWNSDKVQRCPLRHLRRRVIEEIDGHASQVLAARINTQQGPEVGLRGSERDVSCLQIVLDLHTQLYVQGNQLNEHNILWILIYLCMYICGGKWIFVHMSITFPWKYLLALNIDDIMADIENTFKNIIYHPRITSVYLRHVTCEHNGFL